MFILLYTGLGMRDVEVRVQFDGVENDYWSYNCEHWRKNRDDSEHRYDTEMMMQLDPYRDADWKRRMTLPCPQPINNGKRQIAVTFEPIRMLRRHQIKGDATGQEDTLVSAQTLAQYPRPTLGITLEYPAGRDTGVITRTERRPVPQKKSSQTHQCPSHQPKTGPVPARTFWSTAAELRDRQTAATRASPDEIAAAGRRLS